MNKKMLFFALSLFALNAAPSFAQINWDNAPAIPGPEGTSTITTQKVGIGLTAIPTDVDLHVNTAEYMNAPGTSDVNLRLTRNMIGINTGGPHTAGNLIEATVNSQWGTTTGFVLTRPFFMGIGTDAPIDRLNIHDGNIAMTWTGDAKERSIYAQTSRKLLGLYANTSIQNGPGIDLHGSGYGSEPGTIKFSSFDKNGKFVFGKWDVATSTLQRHIVIDEVGDINMVRWHNDYSPRKIMANSQYGGLEMYSNGFDNDGSGIQLYAKDHPSYKGAIHFISNENGDPNGVGFRFVNYNGSFTDHVTIMKNGKVLIGNAPTSTTYDYKLYVEKGILTERLKVALKTTGDWADYVFADDYKLKPLDEVESFINENNHLPDVPSAQEVVNTGIDVAAMDAKLLQKVEELTLYIIEQNKRISSLERKLNKSK